MSQRGFQGVAPLGQYLGFQGRLAALGQYWGFQGRLAALGQYWGFQGRLAALGDRALAGRERGIGR